MATIQLINRLRYSGQCAPSLLPSTDSMGSNDLFLLKVSTLVGNGEGIVSLMNIPVDSSLMGEFQQLLKMATDFPPDQTADDKIVKLLVQRRSILLTVVGSTASDNQMLTAVLNSGYLLSVKVWIEDILNKRAGAVDLLLHLLSCIASLPVSKEMVNSSGLGKLIGSIDKHSICVGTANESAIKDRLTAVKERWSASVKLIKDNGSKAPTATSKRPIDEGDANNNAKRTRPEDHRGMLSELVKKVASNNTDSKASVNKYGTAPTDQGQNFSQSSEDSKKGKRILWADSTGKALSESRSLGPADEIDKSQSGYEVEDTHGDMTWSDRNKRDRLREKELFEQARKAKLVDTADDLNSMAMMFSRWHQPRELPLNPEIHPVQVVSKELAIQVRRMSLATRAHYFSDEDVPGNPTPLSDYERSMEITAERSIIPTKIPFFIPRQEAAQSFNTIPGTNFAVSTVPSTTATFELVQALGLPSFLVGQNIAALQTLAASPGLLNAFIDANGMYDQVRILNLVATLTQNLSSKLQTTNQPVIQNQTIKPYVATVPFSVTQPPVVQTGKTGYRGDQNLMECNLHLSGYGPGTTMDMVISMFSPYVKIDEIVPKNGFMFVNTSDPEGAKRAKEALNGVIVGGQPLRINLALRRAKLPAFDPQDASFAKESNRYGAPALPTNAYGKVDYDSVTDDRGNPATRNLFVAGFGPGTTEDELFTIFSQHAALTNVVLKGAFAFVNTLDKGAAVVSREALTGAVVHGGALRINFAKESGRLGTSFDVAGGNTTKPPLASADKYLYYGRT